MNKEIKKITILVLHSGTDKFLKYIQNSKFIFLMWTIFPIVFIEFAKTTASVLCFGFLAMRHVGS